MLIWDLLLVTSNLKKESSEAFPYKVLKQWAGKPLRTIFKTVITGVEQVEGQPEPEQERGAEVGAHTDDMARKTQIMDFFIVTLSFIGNISFFFEVVFTLTKFNYEYDGIPEYKYKAQILLSFSLALSVVTCIFVIVRENVELNIDKKRFKAPHFETIYSSGRLSTICLDCLIILVHPYPFIVGQEVEVWNAFLQMHVPYYINDFLQWIAMIRLVKAGIRLINLTMWKSNSAQRICFMYGCEADTLFGVKSLMKHRPISFIFGNLLAGAIFFAILLRYCEAQVNKVVFDSHIDFSRLDNCLWLVFVTMTTGRIRLNQSDTATCIPRLFSGDARCSSVPSTVWWSSRSWLLPSKTLLSSLFLRPRLSPVSTS